jgi:FkbM family methyltransferase
VPDAAAAVISNPPRHSRALGVLRPLVRQLPPSRAARLALLYVVKRLAERWTVLSFGQRGEDVILDSLLRHLDGVPPTYVDVGANHPVRQSNTYRLYLRGWCGVLVDANDELVSLCRRLRPRDRSVCAVVSDADGPRRFRFPGESRLAGFATGPHADGDIEVQPRTLTDILAGLSFPERFGVLSVDCEGSDAEVVRSLDLNRFRPRIIVCEQPHDGLRALADDPLLAHLEDAGYRAAAYDGMNVFYVDES